MFELAIINGFPLHSGWSTWRAFGGRTRQQDIPGEKSERHPTGKEEIHIIDNICVWTGFQVKNVSVLLWFILPSEVSIQTTSLKVHIVLDGNSKFIVWSLCGDSVCKLSRLCPRITLFLSCSVMWVSVALWSTGPASDVCATAWEAPRATPSFCAAIELYLALCL